MAKPLGGATGFDPDFLIVDEKTLRVNKPMLREQFMLKFPVGLRVLDSTHEPPLRFRIEADPGSEEKKQ